MPRSLLGLVEEDWETTATEMPPHINMYARVVLHIYPTDAIVKMRHKLMYAKIGILDCAAET